MNTKVALYPGSFNPMHIGHMAIARWLCSCGRFDSVRLMLSPHNPFKSDCPPGTLPVVTDADRQRIDALCRAIASSSLPLGLETIEFTLPLPHYTFNTLKALRQREPQSEFILVIGADNLAVMDKWYRAEDIMAQYEVWVYPRSGYDMQMLLERWKYARINVIDAPVVNISSSMIRDAISRGDHSLDDFIV